MAVAVNGKVAVVTGASRGVGRAIALRLAEHGATVALGARSVDRLRAVEQEIIANGGKARAIPLDAARFESVQSFVNEVQQELGTPAILINNAATFGPFALFQEADPLRWAETIVVNVLGPYYLTRLFLPEMLKLDWGRIVNVSSAAGVFPPIKAGSAYQTSKVALNHFTRCLAVELEGTGITANAIHPGEVLTEMWDHIRREVAQTGPEGDFLRGWTVTLDQVGGDPPEKAVDLVMRLVDDDAGHISGHFHFIKDGILAPMPTWSESPPLPG